LCENVHSIPDDIDALFSTKDLADINRGLENTTKRFEKIELKKEEALVGLNLSRKKADMKIDNEKQELINHIENMARQSKKDVGRKYETAKDEIEKDRQAAKEFKDGFRKLTTEFETSAGNKSQQFVCMNIAKRKLKEGKKSLSDFKCTGEASVSFHVDSGIVNFFRDIKIFGTVKSTIETSHHYTVETVKDMNVKLQDDETTCDISGSCLIEDGTLLLADCENKKLKCVNIETMTINSSCSFDQTPWGVCCTSKDEAVVTLSSPCSIQFVSIGTELKPTRKVNINHNCGVGISFKDDKLYITDNAKTLYIHDMCGKELQKISTDSTGNGLFNCVREIDLSDALRGGVVADLYEGVIILNDQYQRIAVYCEPELQNATSVCTDDVGSIFVCGYNSRNVLQIGYDGKKICDVLTSTHGLQYPESLCFDSIKRRLIVSQNSDFVKIVQLK
ncbi:uncharacterized protein LOC132758193, partial [Ruditapes philippinarum]|uniref:uncharacterized protein LOC132758193 n=1 Tax=Ruditapes philippinarum TaxID=129788 RepID=UPI00295BDCF5